MHVNAPHTRAEPVVGASSWPYARRLAWARATALVALVITLAAAWVWVWPSLTLVFSPWPAGVGEGLIIEAVYRFLAGNSLWPSPQLLANGIDFPYPPLFALVLSGPLALGWQPIVSARVISLLSLVVTSLSAGSMARSVTGRWQPALVAAVALAATSQATVVWSTTGRVDSLALAFTCAGLAWWVAGSRWSTVLAAACFTLALLTKETMVAAPAAVALSLLFSRRWKHAVVLGAGIALPTLAVYAWCNATSDGAFAFDLLTLGKIRAFHALAVVEEVLFFAMFGGFVAARGWVFLWYVQAPAVLRWYTVLSALAFLVTVGKDGASAYYEAELAVAGAVGVGLMAHHVMTMPSTSGQPGNANVRSCFHITAIVLFGTALCAFGSASRTIGATHWLSSANGAAHQHVEAALRDAPGPVLSDLPGDLVLAGRHEAVTDWFATAQLAEHGLWDQQPVLDAIAAHRYAVIALDINPTETSPDYYQAHYLGKLTPQMLLAMRSHYVVRQTIDVGGSLQYFILTPGQPAP